MTLSSSAPHSRETALTSVVIPLNNHLRSFDAGEEAYQRYSSLISANNIPFVRTDSSSRVVMSASNWTAGELSHPTIDVRCTDRVSGFASASGNKFKPIVNVILSTSVSASMFAAVT